jgi:hypothetical protein
MPTKMIPPLRRMLDRAQRRFVRSRSGSVLILVVALLVLMALIGTAYMTMAQFDRASSVQHSFNTEVDLLLDGMINLTKSTVSADLYINNQYRSASPKYNVNTLSQPLTYNYWNATGFDMASAALPAGQTTRAGNVWLATRIPEAGWPAPSPTTTGWSTAAPSSAFWRFISGPLNGNSQFDSPYWPSNGAGGYAPQQYSMRNGMMPTGTTPGLIDGQTWPAWVSGSGWVMAADTDGDGIADAGLFKLMTLDGITYYAAVRIVDNAAAINANTAWAFNPVRDASTLPALPGDFFPSNIDLADLVSSPENLTALNNYRFNTTTGAPSPTPQMDPVVGSITPSPRTDYNFTSQYEAAWMQLGRRLGNPGWGGPSQQYQTFSLGDALALTKGFCVFDGASSPGQLESVLPQSLRNLSRGLPYPPADVQTGTNWFGTNFNYDPTGLPNMPLRPLLVTRNPVSNFCPSRFNYRGVFMGGNLFDRTGTTQTGGGATFSFGDAVQFQANSPNYVWIGPPGGTQALPVAGTDSNYWVYEPWTTSPTKISVNTGTFGQLYLAYWSVMADTSVGNIWEPEFYAGSLPATTTARMFRNPLRTNSQVVPAPVAGPGGGPAPATCALTPIQVMQLRSALAAINTMDLRDGDFDVNSRVVTLSDANNPNTNMKQVLATVYGNEPQPYITEVYANNSQNAGTQGGGGGGANPNGYIYVEIYNPTNQTIKLTNWKFATIKRPTPTAGTLPNLVPTVLPSTASWTGAAAPTIGPNQYIVFTNSPTPPTGFAGPTASTASTPATLIVLSDLDKAFDNELMLFKPRQFLGTPQTYNPGSPTSPYPTFNEAGNVQDMVPVDSYDFSGLVYPNTDQNFKNGVEWHYVRPNDPTKQKAWHFVYPGHYSFDGTSPTLSAAAGGGPTPTVKPRLIDGTVTGDASTGTTLNPAMSLASFGAADGQAAGIGGAANSSYHDVPLQLSNTDMAGPNNKEYEPNNAFPFGGFARNGDIFQVPYIGSYKVTTLDGTQIIEVNPITMDAAFADDDDINDDYDSGKNAIENIGRFCPIDGQDFGSSPAAIASALVDDYAPGTAGGGSLKWRYHFATRLFDFLTVQAPQQDYLPDVDPATAQPGSSQAAQYPYGAPYAVANATAGIANAQTTNTNFATEETAPVDGLVNINTASWRVLATIPWMPPSDTTRGADILAIAKSIAWYRDVDDQTAGPTAFHPHGPFKNIFELNRVPIYPSNTVFPFAPGGAASVTTFREMVTYSGGASSGSTATIDPGPSLGDLSPITGTTDKVTGDFETKLLMLNRISNLITTRSDSYTAYILVQGWRNAETSSPHLVAQRRAAVIIDRTTITPTNKNPSTTNVPMN